MNCILFEVLGSSYISAMTGLLSVPIVPIDTSTRSPTFM
jgi:hypothetical protein